MKNNILKGGLLAMALLSLSSRVVVEEYITRNVKKINVDEKLLTREIKGDTQEGNFNASFFQEQSKSPQKINFDRKYTIKEKEDIEKYLETWKGDVATEDKKFNINEVATKKAFADWKKLITTDKWNKNHPLVEFMEAYSYYQFDKLVTKINPYDNLHPLYKTLKSLKKGGKDWFSDSNIKNETLEDWIKLDQFKEILKDDKYQKPFLHAIVKSFAPHFNEESSFYEIWKETGVTSLSKKDLDPVVAFNEWNKHNVHADKLLDLFDYSNDFVKIRINGLKEITPSWKSSFQYQEFIKHNDYEQKHKLFAEWRTKNEEDLKEIYEATKIEVQVKQGERESWKPYFVKSDTFATLFKEKDALIYNQALLNLPANVDQYKEGLLQWLHRQSTFGAFFDEAIEFYTETKIDDQWYVVFKAFYEKWLPLFKSIETLKTHHDTSNYLEEIKTIQNNLFTKKYVQTSSFFEIKNAINIFNVPIILDVKTKILEADGNELLLTHLQDYVKTHAIDFDLGGILPETTLEKVRTKIFGPDKKVFQKFLDDYYIKKYLVSNAIAKEDQFVINQFKMKNISAFVNLFWPLKDKEKVTYSKTDFIKWVDDASNDNILKQLFQSSSYYQDKYVDESIKKVKDLIDSPSTKTYKGFYDQYVKEWIKNEQIPYDDIKPFVEASNHHSFAYIFQKNNKFKTIFNKIFKAFYDQSSHHKAWLQSVRGDNTNDKGSYQGFYESQIMRDFVAKTINAEYSNVDKFTLLKSRYMFNQEMGRTFTELGGGYVVGPGSDAVNHDQKWAATYHRAHLIDSDFLVKYFKNPVNFNFKKQWEKKFDDAYARAKSDFFKNRYNNKLVSTLIGLEEQNWLQEAIAYWKWDATWALERSLFTKNVVKNEIIDMMLSKTFAVGEITSVDVKYQDQEKGAKEKNKFKDKTGLVSNVRAKKSWKTKWKDTKATNPIWDDLKTALKKEDLFAEIDLIYAVNKLSGVSPNAYATTTTSDLFYKNATYAWVNHKLKNYFVKKSSQKQINKNLDLQAYFKTDKFEKDFAAKLKTLKQDKVIDQLKDKDDAFSKGVYQAYNFDLIFNNLNNDFAVKTRDFEKWFKDYKRYIKDRKSYQFLKINKLKLPLVKSFISDDKIEEVKTQIGQGENKTLGAITPHFEQWRNDIESKWSSKDFVKLFNLFKKGVTYENQITRGKNTYVAMGYLKWEEKSDLGENKYKLFLSWLDDNSLVLRKIFNSSQLWIYDAKDKDIKGSRINTLIFPNTDLKAYQLANYFTSYEGANVFDKKLLNILLTKKGEPSLDFKKFIDHQEINEDLDSFTRWIKNKANFKYVKEFFKDPHYSTQVIKDINTWITTKSDQDKDWSGDKSQWHQSSINYRVDQITYENVINHTFKDDESDFATAKDVFVNRFKKWYEGEKNHPQVGNKIHTFYLWKQIFDAAASKLNHSFFSDAKRKQLKDKINKIKAAVKPTNINSYYDAYERKKTALFNIVDSQLHKEQILQLPPVKDQEKTYLNPKVSLLQRQKDKTFNKLVHLEEISKLIAKSKDDYVVRDLKPGKKDLLPYFTNWYQINFFHIKSAIIKNSAHHLVRKKVFKGWKASGEYKEYATKVGASPISVVALQNWKNYYHSFYFDKWATSKEGASLMWKLFKAYVSDAKTSQTAYQKAVKIYNAINSFSFNKQVGAFIVAQYQLSHLHKVLMYPLQHKINHNGFKAWISNVNNQKLVEAMYQKWGITNPDLGHR